jgi:hypothetical protein
MSQAFTGSYGSALTLTATYPFVSFLGTIKASSPEALTLNSGAPVSAAIYGPAGAVFTVNNTGQIGSTTTLAESFGILLKAGGSINNQGTIIDTAGMAVFGVGGSIGNSGHVTASNGLGVYLQNAGTVTNTGQIHANYVAVFLEHGGSVVNSGGIYAASGKTLNGSGGIDVLNAAGAGITNAVGGLILASNAAIYLQGGAGTVLNAGDIFSAYRGISDTGTNTSGAVIGNVAGGLVTATAFAVFETGGGGSITNAGTMAGGIAGIYGNGQGFVVANTGTIASTSTASGEGIFITGSARITNGSAVAPNALISGPAGIDVSGTLGVDAVTNYGTITGLSNPGVRLGGGTVTIGSGTIINGSATDKTALIRNGAYVGYGTSAGRIENFGSIISGPVTLSPGSVVSFHAVDLGTGVFINGSTSDTVALAENLTGGTDVSVGKNSTIINYGTLTGGTISAVYLGSGQMTNAATGVILGGAAGVDAAGYGNVRAVNAGLIEGAIGFQAVLQFKYNIDLTNAGTIASTLGSTGNAVIMGTGSNILAVDPGAVFIGTVTGGTGSDMLELASAATAGTLSGFGTQFKEFSTIAFDAGAVWTLAGTASAFAGETITGFGLGDTIDLQGFTVTSDRFVSGTGLVVGNGLVTETLHVSGAFVTNGFQVTATSGGTAISLVPCFTAGTQIATPQGGVAVEKLRIGDLVKSAHGGVVPIKWIGTRSYEGRFIAGNRQALPVCIRRHALGENIPARDLYVSPGHAICEGGMLIHASRLLNGMSITQALEVPEVHYFHIELERHDVIFAEDCPVESFLNVGVRERFQNAASFAGLYPEPEAESEPCLPQLGDGLHLQIIQQRLAFRAGGAPAHVGALRGAVEEDGPQMLWGWAQDAGAPEQPVCLEVLYAGQRIGRVLANRYREDLQLAGLGSGHHGFMFMRPPGLMGELLVRRESDAEFLAYSRRAPARVA